MRAPVFTRRGAAAAALVAALIAAGGAFGVMELYALAAGLGAVVVAAFAWVAGRRWDVAVERVVLPDRVAAGESARARLTVANRARRRAPLLAGCAPDGGGGEVRFLLAPLAAGQTLDWTLVLPTLPRGIHRLPPVALELADPFGLCRVTRLTGSPDRLVVHPVVGPPPPLGRATPAEQGLAEHGTTAGADGHEFFALRDYLPGDDLRRVHWPSSAKLDRLLIRQQTRPSEGRLLVTVDLRSGVHPGDGMELALSAATGAAVAALRAGLTTRVVTSAGADSGWGGDPAHHRRVLDLLAEATTHRHGPLRWPASTPERDRPAVVAVVGQGTTAAELAATRRLAAPGACTVINEAPALLERLPSC